MYIINVLVLTVLTLFSCTQGYIVPLCMEDGDVCGERLAMSLPGFSFYTQFCLTSPELEDSAVSHMLCTVCDLISHFTNMVSSGVQCLLDNGQPKQPETFFEIMIEYLGLEHLIEKKPRKLCVEEVLREHYITAICSFLCLISIVIYYGIFAEKRKVVEPADQLTFINKFDKSGDSEEQSSKDDRSSITDHDDSI